MEWLLLALLLWIVWLCHRQASKADERHDSIVGVGESVTRRLPRVDK